MFTKLNSNIKKKKKTLFGTIKNIRVTITTDFSSTTISDKNIKAVSQISKEFNQYYNVLISICKFDT